MTRSYQVDYPRMWAQQQALQQSRDQFARYQKEVFDRQAKEQAIKDFWAGKNLTEAQMKERQKLLDEQAEKEKKEKERQEYLKSDEYRAKQWKEAESLRKYIEKQKIEKERQNKAQIEYEKEQRVAREKQRIEQEKKKRQQEQERIDKIEQEKERLKQEKKVTYIKNKDNENSSKTEYTEECCGSCSVL